MKPDDFFQSLSALGDCAKLLRSSSDLYKLLSKLMSILEGLQAYNQLVLCQAIGTLFADANWPTAVHDDFDISPVIWALLLGPQGLAAGFIEAKVVADVLLEMEEKWIAAGSHKEAELKAFATKLCAWADVVLAPTKPVAARLSRRMVAKGSAVRIVGPA
jgi:hypothetical protein